MSSTKNTITIRVKEYFAWPAIVLTFIGLAFLNGFVLPFIIHEPYFLLIELILPICFFMWFSKLFAEFDIKNKRFRTGFYLWGIKIGKWKKLEIENIKLIVLTRGELNQAVNLHHGVISKTYKFSVYNLWFQNNEGKSTKFLFSYRDKDVMNMILLAKAIAAEYNIEFENRLIINKK